MAVNDSTEISTDTGSRIPADDLQRFQASLARATAQELFYERFYARLFGESAEIGAFFRDRDIASIIAKLRVTLMMAAETAEGKPGLEMYLEMLGGIHRRLRVESRFFRLWREALIATVATYDPQFDGQIRSSWERVIDRVIRCMQQHDDENPQ
jgi:hemoglobin-like flavoprotein